MKRETRVSFAGKKEKKKVAVLKAQRLARFAPVLLRLALGVIFIVHGSLKFAHMAKTIHSFARLGIPLASVAGPLIALLEVVGGLALIFGLGSRLFALLLAVDMLVAIGTARFHAGFVGGWEFEMALLAGLLALALSGPGAFSLARDKGSLIA